MPRFNIKQLFIIIAIISCWLSTTLVDYETGNDVRQSMLLLGLAATGLTAFCTRGRRQVFWLGFFFVASIFAYNTLSIPNLYWIPNFSDGTFFNNGVSGVDPTVPRYLTAQFGSAPANDFAELAGETIRLLIYIVISSMAGFIGIYIYDQTQKSATK